MVDDWVIVGRFGRAHGIKGFILVNSYTDPRTNILDYDGWQVYFDKTWQPVQLLNVEIHDKHILVKVKGFSERELAMTLTNCDIRVPKDQLPTLKKDEFYWHDLIGLQVINQEGKPFGQVTEILPTGSNDVLVIQGETDSKPYLIPYLLGQFIIDINLEIKQIIVDWDFDF